MKNLRKLSDSVLLQATKDLAAREREITLEILHHLREVERRMLYAQKYSSLFDYAIKELRYSGGAAQRRISSMRLLDELPEFEEKVISGDLNLSVLSQSCTFFNQEASGLEEKREVLHALEGKSVREAERELVKRSSCPEKLFPEKVKAISETHSKVTFVAEEALVEKIRELQALLAHSHPNMTIEQAIGLAVTETLERRKPKAPRSPLPAPEVTSRIPSAELKRQVWHRDQGRCTHTHAETGRRCESKHALEYDHAVPYAQGGPTSLENLRLRCRTHNQLAAVLAFGHSEMAHFIPGLR